MPPHFIRAEVLYKHPSGFYAGPNVEWMPQAFFADNANSLTIDPYALLNFRIGYDPGTGWSGYLEGAQPVSTRATSRPRSPPKSPRPHRPSSIPAYGRAIYGGLRYRM